MRLALAMLALAIVEDCGPNAAGQTPAARTGDTPCQ